jgi:hypothetical protein
VPDFRGATHHASGAAGYTSDWDIFCTIILGTILRLADDDPDGPHRFQRRDGFPDRTTENVDRRITGEATVEILLEWDRGTMNMRDLTVKFDTYGIISPRVSGAGALEAAEATVCRAGHCPGTAHAPGSAKQTHPTHWASGVDEHAGPVESGWTHCAQYISLKDLPQEAQVRVGPAARQNRGTALPARTAQVEAAGASWVCTCGRFA